MPNRSSWLNLSLVALLGPGCIVTKDMGEDGTATDGAEGSGTNAEGGTLTGVAGTDFGGSDGGSADASSSAGGESTSGSGESGATGSTGSTGAHTSSGSDSGSDTGSDEQTLCEQTRGVWDPVACGHYTCGVPNACRARIPGCDCGPGANFEPNVGCEPDDECAARLFACGDEIECVVGGQFCFIQHPGPKGPSEYSCESMPEVCEVRRSCDCLETPFPAKGTVCTGEPWEGLTLEIFAP